MYLAKPNAVSLKAEHWFCDISTGVAETAATKKKSAKMKSLFMMSTFFKATDDLLLNFWGIYGE